MKTTETKKLDVRVQKTYEKLYKTFFELLSTRSYESITVLEICGQTGVHRATFYKHFIDKQDFVNFCINRKLDELNLRTGDKPMLEVGTKEFYIDMCEKITSFISENKQVVTDLNTKSSSTTFAEALENAISNYIEERLSAFSEKGTVIGSPTELLSRYYAGAVVALLKVWAANWDKYTKDDIMDFLSLRFNELYKA